MGKSKDKALIFEAAEKWHNELTEYIVPDVLTKEERKSYRKEADRLNNAIHRERERARRKREKAERIPIGDLVHLNDGADRAKCGGALTKWVSPLPSNHLMFVNCPACRALAEEAVPHG